MGHGGWARRAQWHRGGSETAALGVRPPARAQATGSGTAATFLPAQASPAAPSPEPLRASSQRAQLPRGCSPTPGQTPRGGKESGPWQSPARPHPPPGTPALPALLPRHPAGPGSLPGRGLTCWPRPGSGDVSTRTSQHGGGRGTRDTHTKTPLGDRHARRQAVPEERRPPRTRSREGRGHGRTHVGLRAPSGERRRVRPAVPHARGLGGRWPLSPQRPSSSAGPRTGGHQRCPLGLGRGTVARRRQRPPGVASPEPRAPSFWPGAGAETRGGCGYAARARSAHFPRAQAAPRAQARSQQAARAESGARGSGGPGGCRNRPLVCTAGHLLRTC